VKARRGRRTRVAQRSRFAQRVAALGMSLVATWLAQAAARAELPAEGGEPAANEDAAVDVEVRGALLPRASKDPTVASTVLEGGALDAPGRSAAEALARVPGVQIARTGGATDLATLGLRGATAAQTPVYLAGVPLFDELARATDLSTIPLFLLRRAEVYRGNAPIELDRLGMGGAIVFEPELPHASRLYSAVGLGSFGERSLVLGGSVGGRDAGAAVALRADGFDGDFDYTDDRGTLFDASDDRTRTRRNADARTIDGWAIGRLRLGERGQLSTVAEAFSREQGSPGIGAIPATRARARLDRRLVGASSRLACGDDPHDGRCELVVGFYGRSTDYLLRDPLLELPFGVTEQRTRGTGVGVSASLTGRPSDAVEITGGASQSVEALSVEPRGAAGLSARRYAARFFGATTLRPLPSLALRAAGAVGSDRTEGPGTPPSFISPSLRAGALYEAASFVSLYANLGRYVRVPTLGESFGASATLLGNPELTLEKGPTADLGARFDLLGTRAIALSAEVTVFGRYASDLIAYRRSSLGVQRPYNVGSARVLGLEALARAVLARVVTLDLGITATDPRDISENRRIEADLLPYQSRLVVTSGASFELRPDTGPLRLDLLGAGVSILHRASRVADPAGLVVLPEQTLLEADLVLGFADASLALRARASNLLDDRTTDLIGLPLPGRAAHLLVEGALQ
jgi:vitamin B12 transporter